MASPVASPVAAIAGAKDYQAELPRIVLYKASETDDLAKIVEVQYEGPKYDLNFLKSDRGIWTRIRSCRKETDVTGWLGQQLYGPTLS